MVSRNALKSPQYIRVHIILRGNNREPIFGNDEDCQFFKEALLDAAKCHSLAIHAYVFMTNHIHLPTESVPKTMQSVGRRYVQYFNFRYKRTSTLWEGRYRATVVDAENYLLECMRYIELNPAQQGKSYDQLRTAKRALRHRARFSVR